MTNCDESRQHFVSCSNSETTNDATMALPQPRDYAAGRTDHAEYGPAQRGLDHPAATRCGIAKVQSREGYARNPWHASEGDPGSGMAADDGSTYQGYRAVLLDLSQHHEPASGAALNSVGVDRAAGAGGDVDDRSCSDRRSDDQLVRCQPGRVRGRQLAT